MDADVEEERQPDKLVVFLSAAPHGFQSADDSTGENIKYLYPSKHIVGTRMVGGELDSIGGNIFAQALQEYSEETIAAVVDGGSTHLAAKVIQSMMNQQVDAKYGISVCNNSKDLQLESWRKESDKMGNIRKMLQTVIETPDGSKLMWSEDVEQAYRSPLMGSYVNTNLLDQSHIKSLTFESLYRRRKYCIIKTKQAA